MKLLGGIMSKLTYEELILLDNLIYLGFKVDEDDLLINIVNNILSNENFYDEMCASSECMLETKESEWISILEQITSKTNLRKLKIENVEYFKNGIKSACFIDDENNASVVFRGTVTKNEWEDNGFGAYEYETLEQIDALNYINRLKYDNITVTGHSKGGNKAQYVTILSPKISNCISVNAQGFSNEFINKYKEEIKQNKFKIIAINAKYDYVNCLLNSISGKIHYIQTEIQINPFYYHKANILLDENGELRNETTEAMFVEMINHFSESIISNLPKDLKKIVVDRLIDVVELILCRNENRTNILKLIGEALIMCCYDNFFNYPEVFEISYAICETLFLPLLFWQDFVNAEENNSKDIIDDVINKINIFTSGIIRKIKIVDENQIELIKIILENINVLVYELRKN